MKKKNYESPEMRLVELKHADIICTSTTSANEDYETGSTTGWY